MVDLHHDMLKPREIRETMRGMAPDRIKVLLKMQEDSIQTRMMLAQAVTSLALATSLLKDIMQVLGMHQTAPDPISEVKQLGLPDVDGVRSEEPTE